MHRYQLALQMTLSVVLPLMTRSSGVKFRGGSNSDLMTVQEAGDLASLLRREDHLAENASKCPPGA